MNGLSPPPVPSIERKARKKKAKVAPPEPPAKVSVKTAVRYLAIFVKGVPGTVANNEIQTVFNTKALVGRFKSGHCKVLVPESELGRALGQNSVSGHKIRVKKWRAHEDYQANPQQARTKKAPGLYSQVAKTADVRRIKSVMETTIYELRRLLDASRPQAPNGSWKWRGGWRW